MQIGEHFHVQHHVTDLLIGTPEVQRFASLIAAETGVPEVAGLVNLPLLRDLRRERMLKRKFAWCPRCLSDWSSRDLPIYRPLLWSMQWVHACPIHQIALMECCPGCRLEFDHVGPSRWTLDCPRCGHLFSDPARETKMGDAVGLFERSCSQRINELLEFCATRRDTDFPEEIFFTNLETAVAVVGLKQFLQAYRLLSKCPGQLEKVETAVATALAASPQLLFWCANPSMAYLALTPTGISGFPLPIPCWFGCEVTPHQAFT